MRTALDVLFYLAAIAVVGTSGYIALREYNRPTQTADSLIITCEPGAEAPRISRTINNPPPSISERPSNSFNTFSPPTTFNPAYVIAFNQCDVDIATMDCDGLDLKSPTLNLVKNGDGYTLTRPVAACKFTYQKLFPYNFDNKFTFP